MYAPPSFVTDYRPIGKVVMSERFHKVMSRLFKADDFVELTIDEKEVVLKGSTETYTMGREVLEREVPEVELQTTEFGVTLKKVPIDGVYEVELMEIASVPIKDVVTVKVKGDLLAIITSIEEGRYEKRLRVTNVKKKMEEFCQTYDGELLKKIADVVEVPVNLVLSKEGPLQVVVPVPTLQATVTYAIAPRVVT
jgi:hypothetical protein